MIGTIITDENGPALRLGSASLERLGLHPGQRVRLDIHPLPPALGRTPVVESDGFPA